MNQCYLVELFAVGHTLIDLVSNEITTSLVFYYWLIPEIYITYPLMVAYAYMRISTPFSGV